MFTKSAVNDGSDVFLNIESGVELALFGTPDFGTTYDLISVDGLDTIYDGSPFGSITLNGNPLVEDDDYLIT